MLHRLWSSTYCFCMHECPPPPISQRQLRCELGGTHQVISGVCAYCGFTSARIPSKVIKKSKPWPSKHINFRNIEDPSYILGPDTIEWTEILDRTNAWKFESKDIYMPYMLQRTMLAPATHNLYTDNIHGIYKVDSLDDGLRAGQYLRIFAITEPQNIYNGQTGNAVHNLSSNLK